MGASESQDDSIAQATTATAAGSAQTSGQQAAAGEAQATAGVAQKPGPDKEVRTDAEDQDVACLKLSIVLFGSGADLTSVSAPITSTVGELRNAIDAQAGAKAKYAYTLMTESGDILGDVTATLASEKIEDESTITLAWQTFRDYAKITEFERVLKPTPEYPNGVHVTSEGDLYVAYYWGEVEVYGPDWKLRHTFKLSGTGQANTAPSQLALTADGDLLVAIRSPGRVLVFDPVAGKLKSTLSLPGPSSASGLAILGDRVFVSDSRKNRILELSLKSGGVTRTADGVRGPQGMSVVDERLLAVADRESNVVRLFSLFENDVATLKEVQEIGKGDLRLPNDVAVDSGGNLLVMDTANERVAAFRQDGTFMASIMPGWFKNHGNTYSYLACNNSTGAIAVSNNDEHCIAVMTPLWSTD